MAANTNNNTAKTAARMIAANDCVVPDAGKDGTSSLSWNATNHLVSTNWDGGVRMWKMEMLQGGKMQAAPLAMRK